MSDAALDLSYLNEYTDGDKEAINDLLEIFYETAEEGLEEMKANIVDGENEIWSAAAHKLKGASGYVGASDLRASCAAAQEMKVATQAERAEMFAKIEAQYNSACTQLKEYQNS